MDQKDDSLLITATDVHDSDKLATKSFSGPVTPMEMLQVAVSQGADLTKIEKLMELQERFEKNEARKQFDAAIAAFKENPPELSKNKEVDFTSQKGRTHYKHASLDEVALKIGSALSPHGLSFRWGVEQTGAKVKVTCILAHKAGHSETVQLEGEADNTGNKNSIQAVGSTITYLQRYTLLSITGMAVQDQDDDGRGGVALTDEMTDLLDIIAQSSTLEELKGAYLEAMRVATTNPQKLVFMDAKDKRQKELA